MDFSPQQVDALEAVAEWLGSRSQQVFRLFGYAGTGKTTLAKEIAQMIDGETMYAAYTGKAAQVLTRKGCPAATLHSLMYLPNGESKEYVRDADGNIVLNDDGTWKVKPGTKPKPRFTLNENSPLHEADLIVVDEVSMVDEKIGEDLLSFGKRIIVLGDPAQLPPVSGGGFFTKPQPHKLLTEIHRQASGSPVLKLATSIRSGERWSRATDMSIRDASRYDQVIVGTNKLRWSLNMRLRAAAGHSDPLPEPGDKLICMMNNYDMGVMNGQTFTVESYLTGGTLIARDDDDALVQLRVWEEGFSEVGEARMKEWGYQTVRHRAHLTYGWAITCHKAQGSQWDNVLVADEARVFRRDAWRWMYTAVTRAAENVAVVNPYGITTPDIKMPRAVRKRIGV